MSVAVITGAGGLIGSEASTAFANLGLDVVGVDNDMRRVFFGNEASTAGNVTRLARRLGRQYSHEAFDIRARQSVDALFSRLGRSIAVVVHTAAQPSHDWAAREPFTDFDINAVGTLNLLEATRRHAPEAVFLFMSTNKVYGDRPNGLPLVELERRWELVSGHDYERGIREDMPVDTCLHSLFGVSKLAADILVQEYGRYFGLRTACFRGGTLTGPQHAAAELHGFLAYLMRCTTEHTPYTVYGYKGKQVRDAIHCADLVAALVAFFESPRVAEVYNIGGGRFSHGSVLEAIDLCQEISGHELLWTYDEHNRIGDHIWWVSDNARFASHYPSWRQKYNMEAIITEMHDALAQVRSS